MMNVNILEIVVVVVALAFVISGFRTGFVKKLASMLSLVLSIVLVSAILPYVTDFIQNNTPLYDYIVEQCERVAAEQLGNLTSGALSSGTGGSVIEVLLSGIDSSASDVDASETGEADEMLSSTNESLADYVAGLTREETKALMEQYGYGDYTYLVDLLSDEELEAYKEQYLQQFLTQAEDVEDGNALSLQSATAGTVITALSNSLTIDADTQNEIIENLPVPEVVKNLLIRNNNEEGYESLNVSTFQDYIIEYLATMILNVVSFLVAVILVHIVLRLVIMVLNVVAHFPVIGIVNRLAGAALGLVQTLFVLWLFFLLLTVLQTTSAGSSLLALVEESDLLSWVYESNLFLRIVMWAAAIFA